MLVDGAIAWMVAGVLAAIGGVAFMQSGLYDVAATRPHAPGVAWVLHNTMIRSIEARSGDAPGPRGATPAQTAHGLALYDAHCAECHGGPGIARAAWTGGLTPTPPFLLDSARNWTPGELRRIVADGVKMSAMPGWRASLPDADIDDLVRALEALPTQTRQSYCAEVAAGRGGGTAVRAAGC